jgi:hypothetical protein
MTLQDMAFSVSRPETGLLIEARIVATRLAT